MAGKKDYAKLAERMITRPAEVKRMPRILVYSRNKKGKTTFSISAGVDKTLVLDPEQGTDEMKTKNPHRWPIAKWEDMDDVYNFLRYINECPKCPDKHPFTWVSVDGLTRISSMSLNYVMRQEEEKSMTRIPGMVQQRDYGKAGVLMREMLTQYHNLPQGIVFTAQERQVEANDSEEDEDFETAPSAYVPDLPKGARGAANAIVDVIGRLYVVKTDDDPPKPERRLWVGESPRYDTGYRSDFVLPDHIDNPSIPKLVRMMRTGSSAPAKTAAATTKKKKD